MNQNNMIALSIEGSKRICEKYNIDVSQEVNKKWILELANEIIDVSKEYVGDFDTDKEGSPAELLFIGIFNLFLYRCCLLGQRRLSVLDRRLLYQIVHNLDQQNLSVVKTSYVKKKMRDFSEVLFQDITTNKDSVNYIQPYFGVPISLIEMFSASAFGLEKPKKVTTVKKRSKV